MTLSDLLTCTNSAWSPQIGDPSVLGWVTVGAYLAGGLACLWAMRTARTDRRFWGLIGVVLLLLCVNKQLDLQSALTAVARCASQLQGWYEHRRIVQIGFILVFLLVSAGTLVASVVMLHNNLRRIGIATLGFILLITYVAVRAVGFHHMDALIGSTLGNVRLNWLFELSGIVLILLNAIAAIRRGHSTDPHLDYSVK